MCNRGHSTSLSCSFSVAYDDGRGAVTTSATFVGQDGILQPVASRPQLDKLPHMAACQFPFTCSPATAAAHFRGPSFEGTRLLTITSHCPSSETLVIPSTATISNSGMTSRHVARLGSPLPM